MKFEVFGPFEIHRARHGSNRWIEGDKKTVDDFCKKAEKKRAGLSDATGCYIFCVEDRAVMPYYVGKTSSQSFKKEMFTHHKLGIYNKALNTRGRGHPVVFLLPKMTQSGKKFSNDKVGISAFEKLLITWALTQSGDNKLLNKSNTTFLRELEVIGFMHTERLARSGSAKELRDAFGMK